MSGLDVDVIRARHEQLGRELDQLERERDAALYVQENALDRLSRASRLLSQIVGALRDDEDASIPPHVPLLIEALVDVYQILEGE